MVKHASVPGALPSNWLDFPSAKRREYVESAVEASGGEIRGTLDLRDYPFPLPKNLKRIKGDLYLSRYTFPLPAGLKHVSGEINLSEYEYPLPDGMRVINIGQAYEYFHPFPASVVKIIGTLPLSQYKHPLPKNLQVVIGNIDLNGYTLKLPDRLRIVTGCLGFGTNWGSETREAVYQLPLPKSLAIVGELGLSGYKHPLPSRMIRVNGTLDVRDYDFKLPESLRGLGRQLLLDNYQHELPKNLREIGDVRLTDYDRPLPPRLLSTGSLGLHDYKHALPSTILKTGILSGLSAYHHPLPPHIKETGNLSLYDYKFALPEGLKKVNGDIFGLSYYRHPLPSALVEVTGAIDLFPSPGGVYDFKLPPKLARVGSLEIDQYKHALPRTLKYVQDKLVILRYGFPMPPGMKPVQEIHVSPNYTFTESVPQVGLYDRYRIKIPDTQNFKDWFDESKVVDELDKPKVVYHGTDRGGFVAFDPAKKDPHHPGYYFADSMRNAKTYITNPDQLPIDPTPPSREPASRGPVPGAYRLLLSLKNPAIIDCRGSGWSEIDHPDYFGLHRTYEIATEAHRRGYDGVIFQNIVDSGGKSGGNVLGNVYVAFEPTQIKSAIRNTGAYSKTDPDIRKNPRRTSRRPVRRTSRGRKTSRS